MPIVAESNLRRLLISASSPMTKAETAKTTTNVTATEMTAHSIDGGRTLATILTVFSYPRAIALRSASLMRCSNTVAEISSVIQIFRMVRQMREG